MLKSLDLAAPNVPKVTSRPSLLLRGVIGVVV